jgi:hypothetical protein
LQGQLTGDEAGDGKRSAEAIEIAPAREATE